MTPHRPTLEEELASSNVLLVCGSGGVGKTSVAAALAVAEAERGRKVCVLTVDPARRLADCDRHGVTMQVLSTVPVEFTAADWRCLRA